MLAQEQVTNISPKKLEEQKPQKRSYENIERPEETSHFTLSMVQYKQIEREKRKKILDKITEIEKKYKVLSDAQTVGKMLDELLEAVSLAHKDKIMFSMPYGLVHGMLSDEGKKRAVKEISLIEKLIKNVDLIKKQNLNLEKDKSDKLELLCSEVTNLISTGTYVSKEVLDSCGNNIPIDQSVKGKRDSYLLGLEKAVQNSIENDKKEGIVVERDNAFYCVKCPEDSIVTPAKFMNSPEFKDLEYGALRIGEGDNVIRLRNGQYHDMKGRVLMTFKVGDEKLEMALFSKKAHEPENNALNFGTIMVSMDDKNCEIFLKHYEALKDQPRIERIIGRAKSFVDEKSGKQSEPFSVLEEVRAYKCTHCGHTQGL
ncbi:hypothetical protein [Wolbachia endosymbiont of Ctenocephalides felis wCfeT]|uniref:hypothetical protein n=1 Tax=Wolbachia endosymbiont of Ctenocephalides felis wCfeT TaxID=2732593 RepID=UPI001FE47003|nr:hypothetical protein [Wolbachia endosymbiont of Ctenocephalides felis wCfeT]